jgi:hypothetical protein
VFITHRGRTSHVLMSLRDYEQLAGKPKTILELLYMPGVGDFDFEPPRLGDEFIRPADFS